MYHKISRDEAGNSRHLQSKRAIQRRWKEFKGVSKEEF